METGLVFIRGTEKRMFMFLKSTRFVERVASVVSLQRPAVYEGT